MKQLNNFYKAFSTKPLMLLFFFTLLPNMASAQCPNNNHPHMIDLGLPSGTKWACCNVGASKPEDFGGYYAWGETEEKDVYSYETYIYGYNEYIGLDISGTNYDVVHVKWGGSWKMPTTEDFKELIDNCTYTWTQQDGTEGSKFTGNNGNSIFIPDAGWNSPDNHDATRNSLCWTSSLVQSNGQAAYMFAGNRQGTPFHEAPMNRPYGLAVRPVISASSTPSSNINFADPFVKAICVEYWDTNHDGELSYDEAAIVSSLGEVFRDNKEITSFEELQFFTGIREIGNTAFIGCTNLTSVVIPNSVVSIVGQAFYYCKSLTSVTIPESVTSISDGAFMDCNGLTSIILPNGLITIGSSAFSGCDALTSITIPNSVKTIGEYAFQGCSSLTTMTIPYSVDNLTGSAFHLCNSLVSIEVDKDNANYTSEDGVMFTKDMTMIVRYPAGNPNSSYTVPNSVSVIGESSFTYCENLSDINITNSVVEIGWSAFVGCSALTSVILPNSLNLIKMYAFGECSSLSSIIIPNSVTGIQDQILGDCTNLKEITFTKCIPHMGEVIVDGCTNLERIIIQDKNPVAIPQKAFWTDWEGPVTDATLFVPAGTKALYEATEGWKEFQNIVEMGISTVDQGEAIDIGTELDENTDLDGNVVGDVYYCISSGDGSYDPEEGCIVVTKPTDDSAIDGKDIFGEDFKDGYTGFVFMVAQGKGTINVEAETTGNMVLKVKVGDNTPTQMEVDGKTKVSFTYDVSEPTFVFIYGSIGAASAKGMRKAASTDMLKIYGIEVTSETNSIDNVQSSMFKVQSPIYNLNGQRVISSPSGRPGGVPTKGIYIQNGKKVLVK